MTPPTVSRRGFLCAAAATAAAAGYAQTAAAVPAPRRNIVFILTDDQRFDALGCTGHPFLETPHIDALAKNGLICDRAFVTTALCSPSRASVLTGQYAHIHGVLDNSTLLPTDTPTFPKELQAAGYRTGFIGKWHMGGSTDAPQPGFDEWVSFAGQGVYYDPVLNVNGDRVERKGYLTDMLGAYAADFIDRNAEAPFLLYVSHKAVHQPFEPAERHKGAYAGETWPRPVTFPDMDETYAGKPDWVRKQRPSWHGVDGYGLGETDLDTLARDMAECMRSVDDSVGVITQALEARGLLDDTLIVYTSDNGFLFGEHGLVDKRCMYEPSIRVPMIVHCPAMIAGGRRLGEIVTNIDIAPTFVDAAGLPIPPSMQGESFLPLLRGESIPWRDGFMYTYFWERSFPQTPTVLGIRTKTHKLMVYHGIYDRYEIYDIANDPDERNNLLGPYIQQMEPSSLDNYIRNRAPDDIKALFNDLSAQLAALRERYGIRAEPVWRG